jgi:hypothetical protein
MALKSYSTTLLAALLEEIPKSKIEATTKAVCTTRRKIFEEHM